MLSLDFYNSEETCIRCPLAGEKIKDDICAVCLDEDCKPDVMLLGCCHNFHSQCILKWVQKNFSCPLCRQECQSFVPMNGQTLSPEFTKVWETHYLAKTPEPEAIKEHKNENKETIVQKTTTVIEEPPTTEVLPESSPRIVEPVMESPIPLLPLVMADMPLISKQDWLYNPNIPALVHYALINTPSISMTSSLRTSPLAALLFLEASNSIGNRNLRPNIVRVSALEARTAKEAILQNRVSALRMSRLTSKRINLQPLLKPSAQRFISTSATPAFRGIPRHHYKTQILQRTFEKRAITRVTSKMQAKLSILL